jgi:acyl-CoA synthetase (AMP-forming)/AMP-acid ligase II
MQYHLADLFESVVDRVPDRTALAAARDLPDGSQDVQRRTYTELEHRANQLAHYLQSIGIGPGDHVGCHLLNGPEYVETMLACFKIRAVPVNVNYRYVDEELHYMYDNADLVAVVYDAELADRVERVASKVDSLRQLLVVGEGGRVGDAIGFEDAVAQGSPDRDFAPRSPDDLWMLYTGGTTGMPKGVMWRHEDIFFAGMGGGSPVAEPVKTPEELAQRIDPDGFQMAMFAAPPLIHGAAQLGTFITFWAGSKCCLIRKYSGHGALKLIESEKINTISIVGDAMAIPLIEALEEHDYDTSSLFVISTAGAIMSKTVRDRITELLPNVGILDSFGSSETGYNGSEAEGSSPDQGLKFKMTERTAVISDAGRVITPGSDEVGRVGQRGHIPLGYYNDEAKTAETFVQIDGERWVLMGDAAHVDAEGIIHVLGRGSVCINSGGEKIFPEEVESALKSHPDIVDAVVAGVPDERWGERVAAVIQVREGAAPPSQADVEAHLSDRVARYKIPRAIRVVESMQRSPAGKPDYKWARTIVAAESASA